jgi:hypothetical protein
MVQQLTTAASLLPVISFPFWCLERLLCLPAALLLLLLRHHCAARRSSAGQQTPAAQTGATHMLEATLTSPILVHRKSTMTVHTCMPGQFHHVGLAQYCHYSKNREHE